MAHQFGLLTIPAQPQVVGSSPADPALPIFGEFFSAILTSALSATWSSVAPGEPVVRTVQTHNPEEGDFIEKDLPCLYVWRERMDQERLSDGFESSESRLMLMWVYPPAEQTRQMDRSTMINGFDKAIGRVIKNQGDPSWVHQDDTANTSALIYGSRILDKTCVDRWFPQTTRRSELIIKMDGQPDYRYPAIVCEIPVREILSEDITQYAATAPGLAPTQIEFSLLEEDLVVQHEIDPDP